MTRNGATAQGGAVPSEGRATLKRDAGVERYRDPLLADPRFAEPLSVTLRGVPFKGVATRPCATKNVQSAPSASSL
jgi:hypothetical protein